MVLEVEMSNVNYCDIFHSYNHFLYEPDFADFFSGVLRQLAANRIFGIYDTGFLQVRYPSFAASPDQQ